VTTFPKFGRYKDARVVWLLIYRNAVSSHSPGLAQRSSSTATRFHPTAQGWRIAPTLGSPTPRSSTPTGLRPLPGSTSHPGHNPVGVKYLSAPGPGYANPSLCDGIPLG
jgi:hypothetical protein